MAVTYQFKTQPYEHQSDALSKGAEAPFFAYFMDMGTGKSKVLLDNVGLLFEEGKITGACIIAPKSVYLNWAANEVPFHLPDRFSLDMLCWAPSNSKRNQEQRKQFLQKEEGKLKLLFMNVESLSSKKGTVFLESVLRTHSPNLLAIDESTTIKSRTAARTKTLLRLAQYADYRRILTGSPVTQSPLDLFTQCEFLQKKSLNQNSYWGFLNRYAKIQRKTMGAHSFQQVVGYQNLEELNQIIQPFSFRVRKEDCLDLPDKIYQKREVELHPEQKAAYESMKRAAMAFLEQGEVTASTVLTQLMRLQQICSGHVKNDQGEIVVFPSPKVTELMKTLDEIEGKCIIWCNFTHDLLRLAGEIEKVYGKETYRLFYGAVKAEDRQQIVKEFQDPKNPFRFFLGQPRSGGYGLTLTQAQTVIYFSNGFDLEIRLQSEDRAHRIGQTNKVTYIDFVAKGTVDEKILYALRNKINLASQVMDEGYKKWLV
tara:strand:+ start:1098 stop:2546 length:1449 start_codon:yes stop_codon:yes gene_type:complete